MNDTSSEIDVRFEGVEKRFGDFTAVPDLDLEVPRGAFFSLLGPSGCGKTTTLRLTAGFERADRGEIHIRGRRVTTVPAYKRNFGMVFQHFALFPHLSVAANVGFGLRMRRVPREEAARRLAEALELVKLTGFGDRYPQQLSGGQQQRVALARAIVIRPDVLLLDEPLGALDKMLRESMQVELRQLQRRLGTTTIFVTHDQEEALTMSDLVAVMNEGRIEQIGAPREIYERPATEFVAGFLGVNNFIDATVRGREHGRLVVDAEGDRLEIAGEIPGAERPAGARLRIALRPERVRVGGEGRLRATITDVVYKGSQTHLYMERRGRPFIAFLQNDTVGGERFEPGREVACDWAEGSLVVLG